MHCTIEYIILVISFIHIPILGSIFLKANVPEGCPQNDLSEDSLINDLLSVVLSGSPCLVIHA